MLNERLAANRLSDFLQYLAETQSGSDDRLPALANLSQTLGISVASLREQFEVARALGLVEARPRTGIRRLPYDFRPAVTQSLSYALAVDPEMFQAYSELRSHIEAAFWHEAVRRLTPEDHTRLKELIAQAFEKLHANPAQIPHGEHRELHLLIFCRLENPFVQGLLESYWELYEAVGLAVYNGYTYMEKVWQYHRRMVDCISQGDYQGGYLALQEHFGLINQRTSSPRRQHFE